MSDTGTVREKILEAAQKCVCGQREEDYGCPEDNFAVIAALWEPYIRAKCVEPGAEVCILPEDVAMLMALLKIGRIASGTGTADSYVDACGYLACGGEAAAKGK